MRFEVKNVTRKFGRVTALDGASFEFNSGGIIGFAGPNGAGKTTLLKIISGLDEPDSGDIVLDGISAVDYPDKMRRRIGFMPDTLPDLKDISVYEYLDFFAMTFYSAGEKEKKLQEAINFTKINEYLDRRLNTLSKGLKQRVSLARLFIHNPDLWLLDEPAAGLDPRARIELRDILKSLAVKGKMIILSTHILAEIEDIVSGVIIIDRGKIVHFGTILAGGENHSPTEEVIISCTAGLSEKLAAQLEKLPGVQSVTADLRAYKVILQTKDFSLFLQKLGETGFPLAALRRTDRSFELEKLFMESTK